MKLTEQDKVRLHIFKERAKMNASFWYKILRRDKWTCKQCGIQNWENKDLSKPKMEVDHILALFQYGYTIESNLQCLCKPCNRAKGKRLVGIDPYSLPWYKQLWLTFLEQLNS